MRKNRAIPGQLLVEFVNNPRSAIYREVCAISVDENGLQSDVPAANLRTEMRKVLKDLLGERNVDHVAREISRYTRETPEIRIRAIGEKQHLSADSYTAKTETIHVGRKVYQFDTILPNTYTAHQYMYGLLKRAIESGDAERLGLCRRDACQKLWYRNNLKSEFCPGSGCRWKHRNATKKRTKSVEGGSTEIAINALQKMKMYMDNKNNRVRDVVDLIDTPFDKLFNLGGRFDIGDLFKRLKDNEPPEAIVKTLPAKAKAALSEIFSRL
jgi:hypothetical protein